MKHLTNEKNGRTHLFILDRGEPLIATLTPVLEALCLTGGFISGLGALRDAQLGYYELHRKQYIRKTFTDDYELVSLTGNIAIKDGKPFIHVHAALSDAEFRVFGGHLFEANVAVTAEISIVPFEFAPERISNPDVGLATICRLVGEK
jgi:predicted DNA-binding protein with PD1-like motif